MSEAYKIILTSSLTVAGGIVILVFGQIIVKFLIEPLHEQAKLIGEIANSLIFYANVGAPTEPYYYAQLKEAAKLDEPIRKLAVERYEQIIKNEWKKADDAAQNLREQASQLMGRTHAIPLYRLWQFLRVVPRIEDVLESSSQLIGMANSVHGDKSQIPRASEIAKRLRIRIISKRFG
jgi:hypothetical protein